MEIAKEILRQLGGNKFIVMTGAKNFTASGSTLTFRIPARAGANCIRITLNSLDLYDVEFIKIRGIEAKTLKTLNGIYNDMLVETFERETGLCTRLF